MGNKLTCFVTIQRFIGVLISHVDSDNQAALLFKTINLFTGNYLIQKLSSLPPEKSKNKHKALCIFDFLRS